MIYTLSSSVCSIKVVAVAAVVVVATSLVVTRVDLVMTAEDLAEGLRRAGMEGSRLPMAGMMTGTNKEVGCECEG